MCHPVEDQDYQVRFTCTGKIDKLTITLEPPRLTPEDVKTLQAAEVSAADAHQLRDAGSGLGCVNVWPAPSARVLVNTADQSTPTYPVSGRTLAKMEIRASWSS